MYLAVSATFSECTSSSSSPCRPATPAHRRMCSTQLRYISERVSSAPSGRTYAASLSSSIAPALIAPSVGATYGRSWSKNERTCRMSSLPRAPKREHSPSWIGSGSPMSPNIVSNGTPASRSVFAVATSDASLKSTPTISSGRFASCLPRRVRSSTYRYSRSSSVPSPHPVSATIDGCWSSGSSSNVRCTCTLIMSSKNLPCMNPEPITFIVRSTCSSCPSASCENTRPTSPYSTVSSWRSIGRYDSATPNAPHRCTTNAPLSVSASAPSLSPA